MTDWRGELNELLSSEENSLFYWAMVLNRFKQYQDELTLDELRLIVHRSEICRLEFNKHNSDKIERDAVVPKIYKVLEEKELCFSSKSETHIPNIPTTDSGRDADFFGEVPVLAI